LHPGGVGVIGVDTVVVIGGVGSVFWSPPQSGHHGVHSLSYRKEK